MKPYVKLYLDYHKLHGEFIPCMVCNSGPANEVHHVEPKGMGGTAGKDVIENLIALCRHCHEKAHKSMISKDYLKNIINRHLHE